MSKKPYAKAYSNSYFFLKSFILCQAKSYPKNQLPTHTHTHTYIYIYIYMLAPPPGPTFHMKSYRV